MLFFFSGALVLWLLPCVRARRGGRAQGPSASSLLDLRQPHQGQEPEQDLPPSRRNSFPDGDDDFLPPMTVLTHQRSVTYGDLVEGQRNEATSCSEDRTEAAAMPVMSVQYIVAGKSI